ncbi:hypothetical protein [Flammeovirga sp. EKP202]|uniref:hypothetical protein n=1 Tax=Flammeovirga sp. EKP202 TaxID=2770592 RepID=UPI00165FC0E8|nr:hypothetical protein [Flammeovirga sp. EKP202]MBD0402938.1 hypothetical protein [Flammeovirga sp. EKP202]
MAYLDEYRAKFDNLRICLDTTNRNQLRRKANGGNCLLFTYPPTEEEEYITKAKEIYNSDEYVFIDVAELFVKYIDQDGWEDFKEYYKDFSTTPHIVFRSDDDEKDLFDLIMDKINECGLAEKTPILIRTGVLYGTGIENVNIMEDKIVMGMKHPLIIFYPSEIKDDTLYFLGIKAASKYRCTIVDEINSVD